MRWSRIAMAVGALLLFAGFYLGAESPITKTVTIAGESATCGYAFGSGMLIGDVGTSPAPTTPTAAERRSAAARDAACGAFEYRTAWAVWTSIALGGALLLAGFGGVREREHDDEVALTDRELTGV